MTAAQRRSLSLSLSLFLMAVVLSNFQQGGIEEAKADLTHGKADIYHFCPFLHADVFFCSFLTETTLLTRSYVTVTV